MGFESVRGYVELASGLGDITKARAKDAAQGLLSLPAAGITTGGKMAVQAGALADELLAAATANRTNLTALVRSEVDIAITRLGLVSVHQLEEAQAEAARLRAEVAKLRSATSKAAAPKTTPKKASAAKSTVNKAASPKTPVKKASPAKSTVKKASSRTATAATKAASASKSAVSTRAKPAGT